MHLQSVRTTQRGTASQLDLVLVLNPCLKLQWITNNWGGGESAQLVKGWIIEQVSKPMGF
jgi:hypothetical protein